MIRNIPCRLWIPLIAGLAIPACTNGKTGQTEPSVPPGQRDAKGQERNSADRDAPTFSGQNALRHVEALSALGPRPPGSAPLETARKYIESELQRSSIQTTRDPFEALTPHPRHPRVAMANLTADIPGQSNRLVIVGGHYDTKLMEGIRFVGANDGGSSAAVLIELGRVFAKRPAPLTVRLAFFDGEEAFVSWSASDGLYGSKRMVARLKKTGDASRVAAVIVVDMVGDARLRIPRDRLSTPWLVDHIWQTAKRLGFGGVFVDAFQAVEDDHVPFRQIGIAAADLIDLNFGPGFHDNGYWHTDQDTPDKVSAESLEIVGRTVAESVYRLESALPPVRGGEDRS